MARGGEGTVFLREGKRNCHRRDFRQIRGWRKTDDSDKRFASLVGRGKKKSCSVLLVSLGGMKGESKLYGC